MAEIERIGQFPGRHDCKSSTCDKLAPSLEMVAAGHIVARIGNDIGHAIDRLHVARAVL